MKKSFLKFINANRFAIRKEAAENMASSFVDWWDDVKKDSGDWNIQQCVDRRDDGIAVINVDGALAHRNTFDAIWFGQDTYQSIGDAFDELVADESVKGIVFELNSPGGVVDGVSDLAAKIASHRGEKPMGIVAHTSGEMCSAAYWIGSACESIFASESASLGSIGVLCVFRKTSNESVTVVRSTLSPNKAPTPDTAQGRSQIEKELDALAKVFISTVAQNRGVEVETVMNNFGQGDVFVGVDAVNAGLADGVKTLDEVFEHMNQNQNGGSMPNPKAQNGAEQIDVEALQKSAAEAERARILGITSAFAGLGLDAEAKNFIDEGKPVAEAKDFAFDKMRGALAEANKKIAELEAKPAPVAANNEVKKAMDMLDAANSASKEVAGGVSSVEDPVDADIMNAVKAAAKSKGVC